MEMCSEFRGNTGWPHAISSVDKHLKRLRRFRIAIVAAYWRIAGMQRAQTVQPA